VNNIDVVIRPAELSACDQAETFLQSGFWASFKTQFGWKALPFIVSRPGRPDEALLLMERSLGAGLRFAYVPHGPSLGSASTEEERTALLASLAAKLKAFLPPSTIFIRFDPPWYRAETRVETPVEARAEAHAGAPAAQTEGGALCDSEEEKPASAPAVKIERPSFGFPLRRSAADVQPPDTVLLDISRDSEALLAAMKPKWRYNIKLSEKKGVVVSEARAFGSASGDWRPALSKFYELYRETSERDRIALHPESYYAKLFELAAGYGTGGERGKRPDMRLWTATHEGDALAAIITIFWGSQAVYLYGASSNVKRNLMPAYALQWAAIRAAKEAGCTEYDFYGIPPTDDPNHPMAGLYRFKTGFGGKNIHRGGSWDYPLRPLAYSAFRRAEAIRTWYFKDFRKRK
jgi:lipid II:glycine glycyltransferase (peptidoglycan interpeptide bridge formation enzyme)